VCVCDHVTHARAHTHTHDMTGAVFSGGELLWTASRNALVVGGPRQRRHCVQNQEPLCH